MERLWEARPQGSLASTVGAREPGERDLIAGDSGQRTRVRPQQADGAGQDRVEHGLHIRLRLADDPQDVAGGGLRVQRRRQLAIARLELREQPHVLDGDDGLISERFEQRDVAVRESTCLLSSDSNHADRHVIAHHRHVNKASEATRPTHLTLLFSSGRVGLNVAHNRRRSLVHRSRRRRNALDRKWMERPHNGVGGGACRAVRHQLELFAHQTSHGDRVPMQ